MTSAFSSNDTECLSRTTEHQFSVESIDGIWNEQRLKECLQWIENYRFKKVCLQFPDELIAFSINILNDLKKSTSIELCILGDTSYGSCCVDEVAASHFDADAIIHFGHACLSKVTRLPVHYVFANFKLNSNIFANELNNVVPNAEEDLMVFYSTAYYYQLDNIKSALSSYKSATIGVLALDGAPSSLCWKLPKEDLSQTTCIYIGGESQTFFNLSITLKAKQWLCYDANSNVLKEVSSPLATNWMRRRNFFVEKCKDAQSIGIVVGTLASDGYLDVVNRIQTLARNRGIRTYLLSVGKINPAKLANFMEIDCFVFIGCPENNIYTSRDFYKPLLSVFEAELALNPAWREQYPDFYSVDFNEILPNGNRYREACEDENQNGNGDDYDISLVTGRVRSMKTSTAQIESTDDAGKQIEKKCNQMMESSSSTTFNDRNWTGLNPNLGQQEPAKVTKGRSGIAIKYSENEE